MTDPKILTATVRRKDIERSSIAPGRYVWRGPASDPVFAFENCRDFRIENIDIVCEAPTESVFVCERTKTGPGVIPSTMHSFRNVRIFGNQLAARGIWYRATIDENNEHMRADCVSVYGCITAFRFDGQQSKEHLLTHVRTESCDAGVVASSSFQWLGGTCAVAGAGVILLRAGDPVKIQGVGFEACARLLITAGPTTAAQPVVLDSVRYEADQLAGDGEMIVMRHAGPLVIIGGRYGGGKQPIPRIALRGSGEQSVEMRGVTFGSYGASGTPLVLVASGVSEHVNTSGLVFQRAENDPQNVDAVNLPLIQSIMT